MLKLKKTLLKQMLVAMMAFAPLLLVGGKAFGVNDLDIRNANFAAKVDCLEGDATIAENADLCVYYGKITNVGSIEFPTLNFQITFQPYNLSGVAQPTKYIRVGSDAQGDLSLGSGQWYYNRMSQTRTVLSDAQNNMGAIVVRKNSDDGKFYLQASNGDPKSNMPWGDPDASSFKTEYKVHSPFSVAMGMREVSAYHVFHNGDNEEEIDWVNKSITKLELIRQKKYYSAFLGGGAWFTKYETQYTTDGVNWTTSPLTTTSPNGYNPDADQVYPISQLSQTNCTSSIPCYASDGEYLLTLNNGQRYAIGTKKFSKSQLDGIAIATLPDGSLQDPDAVFLPCPFAAYAIQNGGVQMLKRAMQYHWKFKFNYVVGTQVYTRQTTPYVLNYLLGDFRPTSTRTGNYILGKALARVAEFNDMNGNEIPTFGGSMSDSEKITALIGDMWEPGGTGGSINYDSVHCSCIEIYF